MPNEFITSIPPTVTDSLIGKGQLESDKRKYTPSHMARIINRSIPGPDAKSYEGTQYAFVRKGHFTNTFGADVMTTFSITPEQWSKGFGTYTYHGYSVYYKDFVSPGLRHGEKILKHLDEIVDKTDVNKLEADQRYYFAALIAVVIGTAHAFPDGNGRAAIGVANIYINRLTGHKLDEKRIIARNKDLELAMDACSFGMFQAEYNPYQIIEEAEKNNSPEKEIFITLPSFRPGVSAEERSIFIDNYARSINDFMDKFNMDYVINPEKAPIQYRLTYEGIRDLDLLFKDVAVPTK